MKSLTITLFFLLFFSILNGQEDSISFFLNEFEISINRTNLEDENTEDRFGFGLGAFHSMMDSKKINLIFGFEYNLTNQLKKIIYEGHFAHATNVEYMIHNLSIPLNVRYNIGNKVKFFIQSGTFVDLIVNSIKKGIMHTYLPDQNNNIVYKEFSFKEKAGLSNLNYGFIGSIGLQIPNKWKKILILKTEYKLGLNNLLIMNNINFYNRYWILTVGLKI